MREKSERGRGVVRCGGGNKLVVVAQDNNQ